MRTKFWFEILNVWDLSEDLDLKGSVMLKSILRK